MKSMLRIIAVLSVFAFTSCEKWFEVTPAGEVAEDDLFRNAEGFRNSLNGIYQGMSRASLYGQELSWGFIDVLAQYYDVRNCDDIGYRVVIDADDYNYSHATVRPRLDTLWINAFHLIANCNTLLKRVERADSSLFRDGRGELERRLIEGEALAIRAFLHFDILRLFAPAPLVHSGEKRVPYCDQAPSVNFPRLTTEEVLEKVIRDLKKAKRLTAPFDTLYQTQIMLVDCRLGDSKLAGVSDFLSFRGYRLNYYAICGLLARVYLYRGDKESAMREAEKIIYSSLFYFTEPSEAKKGNLKLYDDVIFGLYNNKLVDIYGALNAEGRTSYSYLFLKDREELRDKDPNDVRVDESLVVKRKDRDVCGKYFYVAPPAYRLNNKLIPVLRLSELYHIYIECVYDLVGEERAKAVFAYLRFCRGSRRELSLGSKERLYRELLRDARKEYTAEGQLFYMYKRLNRNITVDGETYGMSKNFVFPLPEVETNI
ncbi:RagB/SusD family nutrient uptake outer membrane protein [Gabonibacter chumensis]|uniref:RagB/SusD family nutrient uptake outer membrane protein n=1 Tax=Gabonibacter chumensis TaxID=2972474 RepID=UPI0025735120|nr:RagB/SusD family nutrient uptake outer membrane protein [Gabonibacter chumensis]MCR9011813.1 RagB/SusD family nutrient uptake outer membrane protein [Gabonibacter chumensis]